MCNPLHPFSQDHSPVERINQAPWFFVEDPYLHFFMLKAGSKVANFQ